MRGAFSWQDDGAGNAMRGVVQSRQTVCHAVDNAQANIGETHAGNVLTQSHAFAPFRGVLHSAAQALADQLDGFQMEHIGDDAVTLGDVTLNGMGQRIHTGGGSQTLGHGGHHVGVDHSDLGDIIGVHADELALLLHVGDDIVDGDLGSSTGGGGHCNGEHCVLLGGSNTFQRADVRKLGVIDDDADGLCGIHGGAAANGHDAVCTGNLEGLNAVLYVLNRRVRLDLAVNGIREADLVQKIRHLLRNAELQKVRIRANKSFFVAARLKLLRNLFNRTLAELYRSLM